jgi:hypothetical protein
MTAPTSYALLGRVLPGGPVGQPGIALVEHDQPAEGGQPPVEPRRVRVFPPQVEMADQAGHDHDVPLPLTEDLVGDVHAVAAAGVPGDRRVRLAPRACLALRGRLALRARAAAGGRRSQGGVLAQDPALQLAQRRAGLDAELAGQDGAQLAVGLQRLRLAPGPV